jgi:hypothetical protein
VAGGYIYWTNTGRRVRSTNRSTARARSGGPTSNSRPSGKEFIETEGSVNGLAVDVSYILWAVNGELPTNPANDRYRFSAPEGVGKGTLTDPTPDSNPVDGKAGADVQGLVAASADGSRVYLAANGTSTAPGRVGAGPVPGRCTAVAGHVTSACSKKARRASWRRFASKAYGQTRSTG